MIASVSGSRTTSLSMSMTPAPVWSKNDVRRNIRPASGTLTTPSTVVATGASGRPARRAAAAASHSTPTVSSTAIQYGVTGIASQANRPAPIASPPDTRMSHSAITAESGLTPSIESDRPFLHAMSP